MKKSICFCLIFFVSIGIFAQSAPTFQAKKGVNISHWLSQSEKRGDERKNYFTFDDVKDIASFGFDHIRIPIDEEQMFLENGEKDKEAFKLLHSALKWCNKVGLKAVVDLHILRSHHFNAAVKPLFTDEKAQDQFYNCWRLLSEELKKYPNNKVAYELMNEPVADDPEIWNVIANRCLDEVRKYEKDRTVIIGSNRWQSFSTVKNLRFPEDDKNIIISFHYYEPFMLTHYKASWTDNKLYTGPVNYPGVVIKKEDLDKQPEEVRKKFEYVTHQFYDKAKIAADFKQVADVAEKWGLPVYCGEFGCILQTPEADQNRWYEDITSSFRQYGFGCATWDFKGSFGIKRNGEWVMPIINSIVRSE